jgi:hypothetical protein
MSAAGPLPRRSLPLGGTGAQQGASMTATGPLPRRSLPLGGTGAQRRRGQQ